MGLPLRSFLVSGLLVALCLARQGALASAPTEHDTDWFKDAKYGAFMHFLPGNARQLEQVKAFDVKTVAAQLEAIGARYFVITLGQNSGFYNAPNSVYERITGYARGERCSTRDLPMDLHRALSPRGIKLLLYLPCQTPNEDRRAQKAFGIRPEAGDQPIDLEFARKWSLVIQEWSDRYGENVVGWWFDGGYAHVGFNESIAQIYAGAARHGNPKAIVTFNPGVRLVRWTKAEDYTAGELNEPFEMVPTVALRRRFTVARAHVPGFELVTSGHAVPHREMGILGPGGGGSRGRCHARHGAELEPSGGTDRCAGREPDESGQSHQSRGPSVLVRVGPPPAQAGRQLPGIHFDFHAGKDCTSIGKNTTRAMIETIIDQVHPDYLQIDCKGHPGLSSYPTKVGNPAPGFVGDPLRLWRQVTAERGVGLFMHYSGVWDSEAIRRHPDWGAVNGDGSRNGNATSFFGPYADSLMIPQLRELAGVYGVDGAWVDGECWASVPDYSAGGTEGVSLPDRPILGSAQAGRPSLVRVPRVPPRGVPQAPEALRPGGEVHQSGHAALQQLGVHRSYAGASLRTRRLDLGRLFPRG